MLMIAYWVNKQTGRVAAQTETLGVFCLNLQLGQSNMPHSSQYLHKAILTNHSQGYFKLSIFKSL